MKKLKDWHQYAPLFLRLVIGLGFIVHGWAKISRGTGGFQKLLTQIGIPFPGISAAVTPYIEVVGGIAILVGAFVTFAAIPLILTMLVAMFAIHLKHGFSSINTIGLTPDGPVFGPPGYEVNLLYIAGLISLIFTGAGKFSVDGWLINRKKSDKGTF